MILSGADIHQYMRYGGLEFWPELGPEQFQQNGVDLILESVKSLRIGPQEWPSYPMYTLGVTREAVTMPNDLMAFVQLRSTWARRGIILPPTVVDAGFRGQITLEIAAFCAIDLPVGERFAHLIFAKLASPSEPYAGRYQGQTGITGAR
jgi:dCTP deaminase